MSFATLGAMSDGSGGLSGSFEFIGEQATNAAKGAGNVVKSATTTAVKQVTGTGGVSSQPNLSGSFDLKAAGAPQGGDLFAPDKTTGAPKNNAQQMFGNAKPLTQAGHDAVASERVYTSEELQKIQQIEQELRSMHAQNNNLDKDIEKARREREEAYQKKLQEEEEKKEEKKMEDMQQSKPGQDIATFQAQRGTEIKGNQG